MTHTTAFPETVMTYYSVKGTANAKAAFDKLESALPTLRGRKFYGYFDPETEEYRACVAAIPDDPDLAPLGFKRWTVPAGTYVYEKIMNWQSKIPMIPSTFQKLVEENRPAVDWSRPMLEYYRGLDELRIMVPVAEAIR
jgi:hypothetical protein